MSSFVSLFVDRLSPASPQSPILVIKASGVRKPCPECYRSPRSLCVIAPCTVVLGSVRRGFDQPVVVI